MEKEQISGGSHPRISMNKRGKGQMQRVGDKKHDSSERPKAQSFIGWGVKAG